MTQEEKAKAYDEALRIARKINSGEGVAAPPDWTVCEVIFPELKKSKDEKIIEAIVAHIKDMRCYDTYYGVTPDEMIAWLEKQGKETNWKPTKEQMKALNDLNLIGNISYVGQVQVLIELYNDLKKLIT